MIVRQSVIVSDIESVRVILNPSVLVIISQSVIIVIVSQCCCGVWLCLPVHSHGVKDGDSDNKKSRKSGKLPQLTQQLNTTVPTIVTIRYNKTPSLSQLHTQ